MAVYKTLCNLFLTTNSAQLNSYSHRINGQLCGYATCKIRNVEKKLGLPPKPKRPLTSFFQFCSIQRKLLLENNPTLSVVDVTRKLSELWKATDNETKQKFREQYQLNLQAYTQDLLQYEKQLTPEQISSISDEKIRVKKAVETKTKKNEMIVLGKPKRPPTAFILYMLSKKSDHENSGTKFSDWLGVIANEWANVPQDVKLKYENESAKLMEQYRTEIIEWESKMIHEGNISVVRKQALINIRGKKKRSKIETPIESSETTS